MTPSPETPTARPAKADDAPGVVEILASSHENYVWESWLVPSKDRYATVARIMSLTTRLIALPLGEIWMVDDASASVWLPPEMQALSEEARLELDVTFNLVFGDRRPALEAVDLAISEMRPTDRHWTLGTMGTRPDKQTMGYGSAVMEPKLQWLDAHGECAALDTSTEQNVAFYERFGFTTVAFDDALPHGAPPVWSMWRDPK